MNAHALLTSQGWRGKGHSLHKTNDAIGLSKPLLLSRKDDTKGLGTKQHFTSDQWWMNAFDEQLKGLDTSHDGKVLQTVVTGKLNSIEKGSLGKYYLYTSFVRGGFLQGTIAEQQADTSSSTGPDEELTADTEQAPPSKETKDERRARRADKKRRKEERAKRKVLRREHRSKATKSDSSNEEADEEKRHRRAKKEEKRRKRQDKEAKRSKKRDKEQR
ncbi:DNA-directed RNA polymerase II subunit RPB1 [Hirsutella rhossiliensis]|uniref:DNA-directed RNA polymerase II subunit RPB1 n=1 Tax=Hirsutella rhossiliensis TaxID=111463 RepID=A0A9P8N0H3_9HYPO|nr:DNA-directed RNA polymerase II subunit RPB1 [Hirsutella rhossiliensis]KAH0962502.1 DNA-directed RNA polymerase II subunit RPB1 [Hirsutella rhossiliensis]